VVMKSLIPECFVTWVKTQEEKGQVDGVAAGVAQVFGLEQTGEGKGGREGRGEVG